MSRGKSLLYPANKDWYNVYIVLEDLDGDEDVDAFIANNGEPNEVWLNNGDGTFVDSGQALGFADSGVGPRRALKNPVSAIL